MMKNRKKIAFFVIVMLAAMVLPLFGQGIPKPKKAPASVVKTIKAMGGVTIGNWWADYDVNTYDPKSDSAERLLEYRKALLKENDIVIREKAVGRYNEMAQLAAVSIMSGKPAAQILVLQPDWALTLYRQNLLYPVSDNKQVNLTKTSPVNWNKAVNDVFTFNKKIYGFAAEYGNSEHTAVLVWNKRLFKEAGLDENLPYDLQKSGKWTWDEFLKISKQLTRDINNDGIIDIYAMPRDLSTEILDAFISGNGAMYVGKDAKTGKLFNATNTPAFVEAVQFFLRLRDEGVMMPRPEGSEWDWLIPAFNDGKVAMRLDQQYLTGNNGDLKNMKDNWGMVLPPKGPRAKDYTVFTDENIMVVPSTYNKDQVDAIMWAIEAWLTPVDTNWKLALYPMYKDRRAVDETWVLIRDPKLQVWRNHLHVPGLNRGGIAWEIWYHDGEAAQLIEAVSPQWNALIEDANE
ncbi:MAG: extracellular solute-binding protein [Treponema sp.]|jgi:ABC-type glycerol-3-phosphate transport system substrate-binding protein|nr:extracellular solute-binding protein [Treponema sp.]